MSAPVIRAGMGGWTYAPWRGVFYPPGLPHARELAHASRQVTAIEINGTFYRTQSPASFAKWAAETPDDFVFTLKGHRAVVNKQNLADAGDAIAWFLDSGVLELGGKLGPILWQFAPTRRFDEANMAAFLALLPHERGGLRLRHALEVRQESFADPRFIELAAKAGVAIVLADAEKYPEIADATADFIYARLQRGTDDASSCYPDEGIGLWAERAKAWASGEEPDGLRHIAQPRPLAKGRDVFLFFIHEGKVRAPSGAEALLARLRP